MERYIMVIMLIVGVVLLFAGLIGGAVAYNSGETVEIFLVYMGVTFVGLILTLIGFAFGVHDDSGGKS